MAENTIDSRRERTRRENFVERHRQLLFSLGLLVGGLILSLGMVFLVLGVAISTEPPGTRFATQTDRITVAGIGLVAFVIGNYVVMRGLRLAGW